MSTQLIIDVRPVEIDGKHYVGMSINGREMEQRGPYPTAAAAEAMAKELITAAQEAATKVPPRAEVAELKDDHEFIADCARYAEGVLSEQAVKKKYRFDDTTWESLGNDEKLIEAIEAEKTRRVRNGSTARERAQVLFVAAPGVLGDIMNDTGASPRHRIESARELRQVAATGPEAVPATDRFTIVINLGEDVIRVDKPIAVGVDDDGNTIDAAPQGLLAAIAANKPKGGDDGEPI
jgi:hypothetical protein